MPLPDLSKGSRMYRGTLIQHIANMGRVVMAALKWTNLPAYVRYMKFHIYHLSSLVTIRIRQSTLGLVVPIGSLKYVKGIVSFLESSMAARSLVLFSLMLIGTCDDLLHLKSSKIIELLQDIF